MPGLVASIPVTAVTTLLWVIITGMALATFWFCVRHAADRSELSRTRIVVVWAIVWFGVSTLLGPLFFGAFLLLDAADLINEFTLVVCWVCAGLTVFISQALLTRWQARISRQASLLTMVAVWGVVGVLAWPAWKIESAVVRAADLRERIVLAVRHDDVAEMTSIVTSGVNPNRLKDDKTGLTAVHVAARISEADFLTELLRRGANPDAAAEGNRSPLMLVASPEVTRVLLDADARVDVRDTDGRTALHYAVERRNYDIVKLLVQGGCDPNAVDSSGFTPLMLATQVAMVDVLVNAGADITITDVQGRAALHHAVANDRDGVAETLIALGADVNQKDANGQSATDIAGADGDGGFFNTLAAYDVSVADKQVVSRMLVDAVQQLNERQVEIMLADGADPNALIGDQTLLCYLMNSMIADDSFGMGSAHDIAGMLLKAGADVDRACVHWKDEVVAPLLACFKADDLRMTEGCAIMLLHAGASLDPVYQAGIEPLTAAYQDDARTLPDRILQRGASLNRVVPGWDLPLHWLARYDPVPNVTIGVLLDAGADPVLPSPVDGQTGVELLARANRQVFDRVMAQVPAEKRNAVFLAPVVATLTADLQGAHPMRMRDGAQKLWTLMDAGADIRVASGVDSILHSVIRAFPNGRPGSDLMSALLDAGAEIDATDEQGDTALHIALRETMADSPYAGILLARGAEAGRQDSMGFVPLLRALERGDIAMVNTMLDLGVDATAVTPDGRTALQLATELLSAGRPHIHRTEIEKLIARLEEVQPSGGDTDQR